MEKTKILIIGGGPAGATTSLFLAKHGIAHMIVDKAIFPRDKVCGDGLDLKVMRVLNDLDPLILQEQLPKHSAFHPIHAMRYFSPSANTTLFHYQPSYTDPQQPMLWTSKRKDFDQFLIGHINSAFADFRQGYDVKTIERRDGTWLIQAKHNGLDTELQADFLIAADGDHSTMLRSLGQREIHKIHYAATVRQYWRNVEGMSAVNAIDVYTPPKLPMSYFYLFPLPNNEVNVGYGMVSSIVAQKKHNLRELFQHLIVTDPILKDRFRNAEPLEKPIGWGLPLASLKRKTFGDGYVIIGDAASMICPTNGEGIGTSMMSGLITAQFVKEGLNKNDLSMNHFKNFDREIYRRLHGEINSYRMFMRLRPWFAWDKMLDIGGSHPLMQNHFKKRIGGWMRTAYEKPIEVTVD